MHAQDKWIEARGIHNVGYLEDGMVVEVIGAGLATVWNVVRIGSITDLFKVLGKDLLGLGIPPKSLTGISPLDKLFKTTDITQTDIEKGQLILFNLHFHSAIPPPPTYPPPPLPDGSGGSGQEGVVTTGSADTTVVSREWDPISLQFVNVRAQGVQGL